MPPRQDKRCSNCLTEHSPGWRRSTVTKQSLCNKCGLHERIYRFPRPVTPPPSGGLNVLTGASICIGLFGLRTSDMYQRIVRVWSGSHTRLRPCTHPRSSVVRIWYNTQSNQMRLRAHSIMSVLYVPEITEEKVGFLFKLSL
ncbi:hypothetical protein R3P38DRAFT_518698 [Favolaschia claudopus]|uniref:GATA-type domain-containing protein n=1 Tax=Favolaschia claudopus TaxID=2862362 RepID=A0AAV9ZBS1_9AGAR